MTNENRSREIDVSLDPEIHITPKKPTSQEANFASRVRSSRNRIIKNWARIAGSAGLLLSSLLPIAPRQVEADSNLSSGAATLIDGSGNLNKYNYLILNHGAVTEQVELLVQRLKTSPLNYGLEFNTWLKQPNRNLECNWKNAMCNWDFIDLETDEVTASGIPIDQAIVAVGAEQLGYRWGGTGRGEQPSCTEVPNNHASMVLTIPHVSELASDSLVRMVVHEGLHGRCNGHNGGEKPDVMWEPQGEVLLNQFHTDFLVADNKVVLFGKRRNSLAIKAGGQTSVASAADSIIQLNSMELSIAANIPGGTKWLKVNLTQEDGPAYTMIFGDSRIIEAINDGKFKLSPEVGVKDQIQLPGQLATLEVSVSNEDQQPDWNSPAWTTYRARPGLVVPAKVAIQKYRLPNKGSETITAISPQSWETIPTTQPSFRWSNSDPSVYYYEFRLSKDKGFNIDPETAIAPVYHLLVHGGVTNPRNSYTLPPEVVLEDNTEYFYQLRPRAQGSANPAEWRTYSTRTERVGGVKSVQSAEVLDPEGNLITHTTYETP